MDFDLFLVFFILLDLCIFVLIFSLFLEDRGLFLFDFSFCSVLKKHLKSLCCALHGLVLES